MTHLSNDFKLKTVVVKIGKSTTTQHAIDRYKKIPGVVDATVNSTTE